MRVTKSLVGCYVEVRWKDPQSLWRIHSDSGRAGLPKGADSLVTCWERGVLTDITDGVLIIEHSCNDNNDFAATWLPEVLVEDIIVFEPRKDQSDG